MCGFIGAYRALPRPSRLLMINMFGINLGFYLVLPFLAGYMGGLGYAAATIGLVLALRTLSQQGLTLFSGAAADRLGCRPMIILGCALRVVAFGLFTLVDSLPGLIAASVLTGLAGAVFSPAVRAYLMQDAGEHRAEAFAVLNTVGHAGALIGPLLGAALITVDFRLVAAVACVIFAVLTVGQVLALPARPVPKLETSLLGGWAEVLGNRRFLLFALGGSVYFALFGQLYLALPVEAQRVSGVEGAVSAVFIASTLIGIFGSVQLTSWFKARYSEGTSMAGGLAMMGLGFVPLAVGGPFLATAPAGEWNVEGGLAVLPILLGTVVFTVGMAVAQPFSMTLLAQVGSERLSGTYYGVFYLAQALAATVVNVAVGELLDRFPHGAGRALPFAFLLLVGLAGGTLISWMNRTGRLNQRPSLDQ
ncbi:MFS transporter [Kineosporia babensis]|uniref:MFS transporter n=1 Tax=Kineosporia babensis TaxID=499548 RepID=A0A9X1SYI3_9ACTN|nr:MFS transporter [Kineosporia babensis]MCD5311008.1 MFS transporter [Kineosporia babensis]